MYEGDWFVDDKSDAADPSKILNMAFGSDSAESGLMTTTEGRVRSFINRIDLKASKSNDRS